MLNLKYIDIDLIAMEMGGFLMFLNLVVVSHTCTPLSIFRTCGMYVVVYIIDNALISTIFFYLCMYT